MRPAQKAPENWGPFSESVAQRIASMRPAQKAPENPVIDLERRRFLRMASMRPAQKAPENRQRGRHIEGADPASMRPAQKAPENPVPPVGDQKQAGASMRPAQKAPENAARRIRRRAHPNRFNEAGAKSAGKLVGQDGREPRHPELQ